MCECGKQRLGWLWLWHGWGWQQHPPCPGPMAVLHCSLRPPLPLQQSKACLDAQNELSLLTAITEILDSTDDETLSPFDTIMDAELLTSPRERENPSVSCGAEPAQPQNGWDDAQAGLCRAPSCQILARGCPEVVGPWSPASWDNPCDQQHERRAEPALDILRAPVRARGAMPLPWVLV